MPQKMKVLLVGDAMIPGRDFEAAARKFLGAWVSETITGNWEENWDRLQKRRLEVEKKGPGIEPVVSCIRENGRDASMLLGLFVPVSREALDCMPGLRIVGVSRAGLENVDVQEATRRGILVFNVEGRNAEAVSDFAVGMMLAECRNIARAHVAIRNGTWRKEFSNSDWIPELKGKTIGIVGFGYIGRLVARKLSGFDVDRLVCDPFVKESDVSKAGCRLVDKDTLLRESDFVTFHARLSPENRNMLAERELSLMKPTAYIINTARAGLIKEKALIESLKAKRIAGAALDVFEQEPIAPDSELLALDNVTLTSHLAGTTREALSRSPELLAEDVSRLLMNEKTRFIANPPALENPGIKSWLEGIRK